ncbi:methyltransferase domain-containing protein [Citreimonas salinaria]|uniref:Methyltransferase domain-containing protein n=1 Tax=Citreimonas salinaria TaxID=321339 RepID=A0A1H3NUW9_9RHOB|nr:methyltransferase domain-containing protein [Citreimonas salinaria]SDY92503.1 Methyltransferase domain-containing protein [Citreimonas salinaria]
MQRLLVPEMLDELPADDPRARASRADLRRINGLMLNASITAAMIRAHTSGTLGTVVDLGCGDGTWALRLARTLSPVDGAPRLVLLDMQPVVTAATHRALGALGWRVDVVTSDAEHWMAAQSRPVDLVVANLFLHHFEGAPLRQLMNTLAANARRLVATEPLRTPFSYAASRAVGAIGANAVTRHDAPASVRAGFRGDELSRLWSGRVSFEGRKGLFTHGFAAKGNMR